MSKFSTWISSLFFPKDRAPETEQSAGDRFGHACPRPSVLSEEAQAQLLASAQNPMAEFFTVPGVQVQVHDPKVWKPGVCGIIENLVTLSSALGHHPEASGQVEFSFSSPAQGLRLIQGHLEGETAALRAVLNDPSHSKASLNVLWTLFTEFSRIRDAAEMDLHYEQEVELRLVERHSDLLSTRTKIHFDAIEGEISPEVREVCHHATRKIHFLLAHSCLPLPGLDGEAQNRLVAFFHAVENLIAGLSDWILGSSREERDSKATMYLDVIDSVQRANIVDLRNQDYSSFMTRIKHLEEFLDVVQDRIPGELIDDFETECMYFETRVMEPQLFEERVQGIVDALSALNVPDSHLGIVQECMAELMTLELPLEDAEIQLSSSQSVGSIIMRLSDVVERLQKLLEPSTHYLPSGLPASKPSKVR